MEYKQVNTNHNLYIIRAYGKNTTLIKFGYSSNILGRLAQYYSANPLCELVATYYREDAESFELGVHKLIKSDIGREWYDENKLDTILDYINDVLTIEQVTIEDKLQKVNNINTSYKDMAKLYLKTKDLSILDPYKYKEEYYKLITDCIKLYNKVWTNFTYAQQMVANYSDEYATIKLTIEKTFKKGIKYPSKEIKDKLKVIYHNYGMSRTPKATDLQEFVKVKVDNNGSRGFIILE